MKRLTSHHGWNKPGVTAVMLACLLLFAVISVVQVSHLHSSAAGADHCTLCVAMHSAAPVSVAAIAVVLVQMGVSAPAVVARAPFRPWQLQLFTRPPPRAL